MDRTTTGTLDDPNATVPSNPALDATVPSTGKPVNHSTVLARAADGKVSLDTPPRGPVKLRSAAAPPLKAGEVVAQRYRVGDRLGAGGMGLVFAATDVTTGESVALKVMKTELGERPELLMRFRHEYRLMATLRHPNLIEVRDYVLTEDGLPCIIMEFVVGDDVSRRLPLPWEQATRMLYQVCSSLAFLHARGYIHHDIKPSNVRVCQQLTAGAPLECKLMDFGVMEPLGARVEQGGGTPVYLPPEALVGGPTDHRLDLYGLGVTAWETLAGKLPFTLTDRLAFLREKGEPPPDVRRAVPDVPAALAELVSDLMAVQPADRPYDAAVVLRRLRRVSEAAADASAGEGPSRGLPYLRPSRVVGRDPELAALADAWQASGEGPRLALVHAPAGAGKTALLREFQLRVRLRGAMTIEGNGGAARGAFGLLWQLGAGLLALSQGEADQVLRAQAPWLVRIFPALEGRYPDIEATRHADPTEDRTLLHDAVRAWFAALLKRHRITLLLDDLQAADAASIGALGALLSDPGLAGLLVVAAYRPPVARDGRSEGAPWKRLAGVADVNLELAALTPNEVAELLEALFGHVELFPRFVEALAEAGHGNPSFLIEVIRRLTESGQVRFVDERWQLPRELRRAALPSTLGEALRERVGVLGAEARQVAAALAVANRDLSIEQLHLLSGLPESALFTALDQLVAAEAVDRATDGYRLSSAFPRDEFYQALSVEVPPLLHRRAGELLEAHYRSHGATGAAHHAAELAEHFRLGAKGTDSAVAMNAALDKAKQYLAIACAHLYEVQALADAVQPLGQLEQLLVSQGAEHDAEGTPARELLQITRARLARIGLAVDLELAARYFPLERKALLPQAVDRPGRGLARLVAGEALRHLRAPRRLMQLPARLESYFVATTYHSVTHAMRGEFAAALRVAEDLKPFITGARSIARGGYEVCRSVVYIHQGRVRECLAAVEIGLDIVEDEKIMRRVPEIDRAAGLGGSYTAIAQLLAMRGRPEAWDWIARLEKLTNEANVRFNLPNLFLAKLEYHLYRGELDKVREVEAVYKVHHARAGRYSTHLESQILAALARSHLRAGNLSAAEALCTELAAQGADQRDFFSDGWGACISGDLWRRERLPDRARASLRMALAYATRPGERSTTLELRVLNCSAELELDEKRWAAGREFAARALAIAQDPAFLNEYETIQARRSLCRVALATGDTTNARQELDAATRLAEDVANPLFATITAELRNELRS